MRRFFGVKQKLFPLELTLTSEGIVKWLDNRIIPKNRAFVDEILKSLDLSRGNTKGIIDLCMGLNAVTYDLENWKGILASKCKLFTDINTSYIPIGRIVRSGGLKACLDYYAELGGGFEADMRSMLVFDAVVYNVDRHFGNFGILRDNHSGAIIAPAPLYDHGLSLFNYAMKDDIAKLDEYAVTRFPAYGNITFENTCLEVMGNKQAQQLSKLIGFKFKRHSSINWPEERLAAIEQHTQKRVRQLLGLERSSPIKPNQATK